MRIQTVVLWQERLQTVTQGVKIGVTFWYSLSAERMLKRTLAQHAGRIHRTVQGKTEVHVYDYIDTGHPMLERMFYRRSKGYRAMGYELRDSAERSRQHSLI